MDSQATMRLLERARGGETEGVEEFWSHLARRLLPIVRVRLGPSLRRRLDSEDILQAALCKAFQGIGGFEGQDRTALMAWLAAIVTNEVRDQAEFHGRQRRDAGRDEPLAGDDVPESIRSLVSRLALGERELQLHRALDQLTEEHRQAIVLRRFEELSYAEMAKRMGKTPDACRMLFGRAMAALTSRMAGSS